MKILKILMNFIIIINHIKMANGIWAVCVFWLYFTTPI